MISEKLDGCSLDIAAEKRRELLELFPEARTEGDKIDFDRFKQVLGECVDTSKERYGLVWPGKSDCFKTIQTPSMATLLPKPEKSINFETAQNLMIEGDNLEVLKLLQKSYLAKVKMIYVDPPYNTGNDFIYPDDYGESLQTYLQYTGQVDVEGKRFGTNTDADGRFHSKWLTMMYPRLYLARNLLRDDGVLFVTVDDTEVSNLDLMLRELFGEENFVACIIWQHSIQPKGYTDLFSVHHNFILCYQKSSNFCISPLERTDEDNKNYSNPDNDPRGAWRIGDVRNALYRPNLRYEIKTPSGKKIPPPDNGWRWSKETLAYKITTGEIVFSKDESRIIRKIYLSTVEGRAPETIWFGKDVGTTRDAAAELKALFDGNAPFETPKPLKLVKRMLSIAGVSAGDIVLDFFAGSGTTAQAVLELNAEDDGGRASILVQLPEPTGNGDYPTIADIAEERLRRAIKRLDEGDTGRLNLSRSEQMKRGFRTFALAESNVREWDAAVVHDTAAVMEQLSLSVDHLRHDRTELDIVYEVLLKSGYPLSARLSIEPVDGQRIYSVADGTFLICLAKDLTLDLIRGIAGRNPERALFLDEGFVGNDQLKANADKTFKAKGINFRTL